MDSSSREFPAMDLQQGLETATSLPRLTAFTSGSVEGLPSRISLNVNAAFLIRLGENEEIITFDRNNLIEINHITSLVYSIGSIEKKK